MNNHIHILLRVGQEKLETILKRIAGSYVYWYNFKYNRNDFTCIDFACSILGRNDFFEFNNEINDDKCLDDEEKRRLTDKDGMELLQQMLKGKPVEVIVEFEEKDKAALISRMKSEGLSIRQISRLTGVSIGIVRKY